MFIFWIACDRISIWKEMYLVSRKIDFHMVEDMYTLYRYTADVFDTREMVPWIRTFICRLTRLNFSNRTVENELKADIQEMYRMYGIDGGDGHDFQ